MKIPVESAKAKVAALFAALSVHPDTQWRELVNGGFEANANIPIGAHITACVGLDGEYAVFVGKAHGQRQITLMSGYFVPAYVGYPEEAAARQPDSQS